MFLLNHLTFGFFTRLSLITINGVSIPRIPLCLQMAAIAVICIFSSWILSKLLLSIILIGSFAYLKLHFFIAVQVTINRGQLLLDCTFKWEHNEQWHFLPPWLWFVRQWNQRVLFQPPLPTYSLSRFYRYFAKQIGSVARSLRSSTCIDIYWFKLRWTDGRNLWPQATRTNWPTYPYGSGSQLRTIPATTWKITDSNSSYNRAKWYYNSCRHSDSTCSIDLYQAWNPCCGWRSYAE